MQNKVKYFIKNIFKKDNNNWSICHFKSNKKDIIFSKNLSSKNFKNLNLFNPPKHEFWADPFLFRYKKKIYIFFEKYLKKENRGIISVGELRNNRLINIKDIFAENYHLSYPYIFRHNKKIYLVPESYQAKKLQLFESTNFPSKWKLVKNLFKNEKICDPTFFKHNNSLWLFINKTKKNLDNFNKKLFLYKINNDFSKITPHKKNPIKSSYIGGRSAGPIIKLRDKIIRPAQIYKKNNYGFGIIFFEIKKLNIFEYREKKISSITPKFFKKCRGIHHISNFKNEFVIDLNLIN